MEDPQFQEASKILLAVRQRVHIVGMQQSRRIARQFLGHISLLAGTVVLIGLGQWWVWSIMFHRFSNHPLKAIVLLGASLIPMGVCIYAGWMLIGARRGLLRHLAKMEAMERDQALDVLPSARPTLLSTPDRVAAEKHAAKVTAEFWAKSDNEKRQMLKVLKLSDEEIDVLLPQLEREQALRSGS